MMIFDYSVRRAKGWLTFKGGVSEGRTDGSKICAAADGIFTFAPNASSITREAEYKVVNAECRV